MLSNESIHSSEGQLVMPTFNFGDVSEKRSKIMSSIRNKNTKPELLLRKALYHRGFRYRINYRKLPGKPDIVFIRKKIVVFCDGDFWHGNNWEKTRDSIKTNRNYWIPKIEQNIKHDQKINQKLKEEGWTVLRFWESEIIHETDRVVLEVESYLKNSSY